MILDVRPEHQVLHLGPDADAEFRRLRNADGGRFFPELPGDLAEGNPEYGGLVIRLFRRVVVGKRQDAEKMRVFRFFLGRWFLTGVRAPFCSQGVKKARMFSQPAGSNNTADIAMIFPEPPGWSHGRAMCPDRPWRAPGLL